MSDQTTSPSWYDVLDVDHDASADEVRAAWRAGIADLEPGSRRFAALNAAAEVLLGALRSKQSRVASNAEAAPADYHLPLEQVVRHEVGGETIEVRNVVLRVGAEMPSADVLTVPVGARLVESDAIAARRMLDELDGVRPAQH